MNDDLNSLDFDDELDDVNGDQGDIDQQFDPDNYVKPYLGPNGEPEPPIDEPDDNDDNNDDSEDDLITALLKSRGVNGTTIKMENEDGTIEEKDFNSLSREEQLNILNATDDSNDDNDLEEDEIELLSLLRSNNISVEGYLNWVREQAVQDYINSNANEFSDIDSLTDDELFLLDLKETSPDLTDEELITALEHEKTNATLWEKRMQGLRNNYKEKEAAKREEESLLRQEEEERQALDFQEAVQNAVNTVDVIGEFELEDSDKEDIANFILGTDATGVRYFARAVNDPQTLTKMAWFALKGEDALDDLARHYKELIDSYSKANYKKGYEDGKNGIQPNKPVQKATVRKQENKKTNEGAVKPLSAPYMIDLD